MGRPLTVIQLMLVEVRFEEGRVLQLKLHLVVQRCKLNLHVAKSLKVAHRFLNHALDRRNNWSLIQRDRSV